MHRSIRRQVSNQNSALVTSCNLHFPHPAVTYLCLFYSHLGSLHGLYSSWSSPLPSTLQSSLSSFATVRRYRDTSPFRAKVHRFQMLHFISNSPLIADHLPEDVDYVRPETAGVDGAVNFYLTAKDGARLGVWHLGRRISLSDLHLL